jgi:hypothetical protein
MLVQPLERFVVEEIVNTRPYAVANVQIFLDEEELPWVGGGDNNKMTKTSSIGARKRSGIRDDGSKCEFVRGAAAAHEYEFNEPMLPVPGGGGGGNNQEINLTKEDVPWLKISSLLSVACYSADD